MNASKKHIVIQGIFMLFSALLFFVFSFSFHGHEGRITIFDQGTRIVTWRLETFLAPLLFIFSIFLTIKFFLYILDEDIFTKKLFYPHIIANLFHLFFLIYLLYDVRTARFVCVFSGATPWLLWIIHLLLFILGLFSIYRTVKHSD